MVMLQLAPPSIFTGILTEFSGGGDSRVGMVGSDEVLSRIDYIKVWSKSWGGGSGSISLE